MCALRLADVIDGLRACARDVERAMGRRGGLAGPPRDLLHVPGADGAVLEVATESLAASAAPFRIARMGIDLPVGIEHIPRTDGPPLLALRIAPPPGRAVARLVVELGGEGLDVVTLSLDGHPLPVPADRLPDAP